MEHKRSEQAFRAARKVMPGGVSSPVRAFGSVGGTPVFMKAGYGAEVTDIDGNRYIDMLSSWGPLILGHADPKVMRALYAGFGGTSFGAPTPNETRLAKMLIAALPAVEMVRFVSSGTEATMSALRLARAATGRDKILKFAGCYHGHVDALLVQAGSGVATLGLPDSPGVTAGTSSDTIVVPYNDSAAVREAFAASGDQIAAVIVEPVAANMGVVPPSPGFGTIRGIQRFAAEPHGDDNPAGLYAHLDRMTGTLTDGLEEAAKKAGIPVTIQRVGSMFTMFFQDGPVANLEQAKRSDTERFARFFHAMLDEGVYWPPSQFEAVFLSAAHSAAHVDDVVAAAGRALERIG
jgi:glutamate-1-semialdehyde aminotransferase